MTATVAVWSPTRRAVAVSVFEVYRRSSWPWTTARMAQLTMDAADLIAAEPGVLLREGRRGLELYTLDGWQPIQPGDYVVRYGHDPAMTAVAGAEYVHANYTTAADTIPTEKGI